MADWCSCRRVQVHIAEHWRPDELTHETVSTAGCRDPALGPCLVSTGVFDLKWESQLQVRLFLR